MPPKATIPAERATPGRKYQTPRGTVVTMIGNVDGSTDVKVENEHGRAVVLPASYPLEPVEPEPETTAPPPAAAAPPAPAPVTTPTTRTAACGSCKQIVPVMSGRAGLILAAHSAPGGAYCPGSGAVVGAPLTAAELGEPVPAPSPAAASLEAEPEPEPTAADPLRHLAGAETADDRVEAVRRIASLADLAELEEIAPTLQAKVVRELERQRKALEAVIEAAQAARAGNQRDLQRLTARQDYQARPGVMGVARAAFAEIQGAGQTVDHGLRPLAPSDLEAPELPEELNADNAPAELAELAGWICRHTGRAAVPAGLVSTVQDLAGTVRMSRAAIPACDDSATVTLAYAWEASRPEPRETILDQLAARITALGGNVPERPSPGQVSILEAAAPAPAPEAAPPAPAEEPRELASVAVGEARTNAMLKAIEIIEEARAEGEARPRAYWTGRDGSPCPYKPGTVDAELWQLGRTDFEELVAAGVLRPVEPEPAAEPPPARRAAPDVATLAHAGVPALPGGLEGLARRESAASVAPWDLSALPVADQIASVTRARAMELVGQLATVADVVAALTLERGRAGGPRADVVAAVEARSAALAEPQIRAAAERAAATAEARPSAAAAPAPEPAPEPSPAAPAPAAAAPGAAQTVQVRELIRVDLPDGRPELWARPETGRPVRVGAFDDPALASARAAYEAQEARRAAAPRPSAQPVAAPPPPPANADVVAIAQAGLGALAAALPALHALGLAVEIKITTR